MRFTYKYRTKDNVEHCGEVSAANREAAFQAIRAQGIKPGQLQEAPGVFNKLFGKGKRWLVIAFLLVAVGVSVAQWLRTEQKIEAVLQGETFSPRHQIYGDPDTMSRIAQNGFVDIFDRPGDRLLAQFAQPGRIIACKGLEGRDFSPYLESVRIGDVEIADADIREVRELKQIVNGMRREMNEYLSDGVGTCRSYLQRLIERYWAEKRIYDRVAKELSNEKSRSVWRKKNEELRRMGLATIVFPED